MVILCCRAVCFSEMFVNIYTELHGVGFQNVKFLYARCVYCEVRPECSSTPWIISVLTRNILTGLTLDQEDVWWRVYQHRRCTYNAIFVPRSPNVYTSSATPISPEFMSLVKWLLIIFVVDMETQHCFPLYCTRTHTAFNSITRCHAKATMHYL
jgi:hypothetical protein